MQAASKSVETHTPSWEESLSAWMDGEATDDVLPDLLSHQGRQTWNLYHLIGDTLRNADLAVTPSVAFGTRLVRALEQELPIVAAPARRSPLHVGLSGLVAAVVVVTLAWVAHPYLIGSRGLANQTDLLADAGRGGPTEDSGLHDYLEAHQQMAGQIAVRQVSFDIGTAR
jgi:sigma-E factor negative regulatory protein RseA